MTSPQILNMRAQLSAEIEARLQTLALTWNRLRDISPKATDAVFRESLSRVGLPGGWRPNGRDPRSLIAQLAEDVIHE